MFDTECVLDLKTDRIIFPFTKEYLDYQDWITNNPNEYSSWFIRVEMKHLGKVC